jgi:uncharacterized protein (DUF58 family)
MRFWLHRIYYFWSGVNLRGQRRFTRGGWLVLGSLGCAVVLGLDTLFSLTYQAIFFLAGLLGASLVSSGVARGKFSASRLLPRYGTVGQPLVYHVRLRNQTGRVQRSLTVGEDLEDPRPSLETFRAIPEPGEEKRNWFDRFFGYYRWRWLMERTGRAEVGPCHVRELLPGQELELRMELWPRRRGVLRLTGLTVSWPDPLGLCWCRRTVAGAQTVVILPKRYRMPRLDLPGSSQYQPGGVALARAVGESEEFIGMRDYRAGDPMRHIHWRSWAKAGRPIVKEYQDEFFVRHALILDTYRVQGEDDVFEEGVSVAASLACTVEEEDSLLDLLFVGTEAYCFTAGRGLAHPEQLLEVLAGVPVCRDQPFGALENLVLRHAIWVSGCVAVFLAWDEDRRRLVRRLESMGIPVEVFVIVPSGKGDTGGDAAGSVVDFPERFHCLEAGKVEEGLGRL